MRSSFSEAMHEQLSIFNRANTVGFDAYQKFLRAAQNHDFAQAGNYQLVVSASMDSAMDAFMEVCRLQQDNHA